MCASWKNGYQHRELIEEFEKIRLAGGESRKVAFRESGDESTVSFDGFRIQDLIAITISAIDLDDEIPELRRRRIVTRAVFKTASRNTLNSRNLLAAINRLEAEWKSAESKRFTFLSSMSVKHFYHLGRVVSRGTTITFNDDSPSEIEQTDLGKTSEFRIHASLPEDYTNVRAFVDARDEDEAAELAFDAIDLIRGIWCYYFNSRKLSRESSIPTEVNDIKLGPLHMLRESPERWWFDSDYPWHVKPKDIEREWYHLKRFQHSVQRDLRESRFRRDLEGAVIRYVRALDARNLDTAFLKLWGVLEYLTDTTEMSSDHTVRRAAFAYPDAPFIHIQTLAHLRSYRNLSVHRGESSGDIERLVFQLKRYVEHLLWHFLRNSRPYATLKEASEYLDLSPYPKELDDQISHLRSRLGLLNRARRFRENVCS
jgi:hypothetical protein